ncbi:transmembrane protein 218 [Rhincodon typus]|uniref:transmembrane protein 218 n=1 Tax=Rhincodon typus TaxID=259920 RepID=UPI0009A3E8F4|nr:transmembrane protein 218 [Rhincodon typus]XP_048471646.1 transmembrane protein 218 [Rhincodon typus]XP_048471647.1 transmembrane protein 218 [Rhincodon typus]XP_048471648.1 transmembrane protein 218 [Rhincodon typus]
MAGVVMGVGAGVFILAVVWVLSLLICMLLSRSGGVISWLSIILVFFLALMITLILIFFPRAKETPESVTEDVIYDSFFIGRYCLLCILIVTLLTGLILLFPHYIVEHVEAKFLRN